MYMKPLSDSSRYSVSLFAFTGVLLIQSVPYWVNFYDDLQILSDKAMVAVKPEYLSGSIEDFEFIVST